VELALDGYNLGGHQKVIMGFQSLFSWNLLLMGGSLVGGWLERIVSILVFVELALDGRTEFPGRYPGTQFQSLFSWNLLLM